MDEFDDEAVSEALMEEEAEELKVEEFVDEDVEDFPVGVDEEAALETTAEQVKRGGDIQGIRWDQLQFSREHYRETRLKQYNNYLNLKDEVEANQERLEKECKPVKKGASFFDFSRNMRAVHSTIVHFQLRHLLWPTSKHDVFVMHDNCINHYSCVSRRTTKVVDLAGGPAGRAPNVGRVQISTMCVHEDLVAAGGFHGELVVKNLSKKGLACSMRVTHNENGITNGIDIYRTPSGARRVLTSNNDCAVRTFCADTFKPLSLFSFPWAVNYATVCPQNSKMMAVVGDNPEAVLADAASGEVIHELKGHLDYSFAAAWHPNGRLLATGNQDTTTRVWDVRQPGQCLAVLRGRMGAVRSVRFSSDGRFLACAEPADFVHIYDIASDFSRCQEIDLFGEIAGIGFSPDAETFFVSIADMTYSSLMEFNRSRGRRSFL